MRRGGQFEILTAAIIAAVVLAPTILIMAEESVPKVIINEVAWAGSTTSSSDEWIELKNTTGETVDVGGWQLTKNTGEEQLMLTIPEGKIIDAGGYFLISNFDESVSVLAVAPDVADTSVTLSNDKLQIKLYKGDWQSPENLMDIAGDGGVPPAGNNTAKSSMERDDDSSGWHDALASINFDDNVTDLGTPAAENSKLIEPPTVESISPHTAEIGEILQIESIVGSNFSTDPPPVVQLKFNEYTILAGNIHAATSALIDSGEFSLSGAEAGRWDVVVTNPNGMTATLPQAVEITEPPPEYDLTATVRLNEIYPQPNTTSNDEFIELYNFGDKTVNLSGWILDDVRDGGSSPFVFDSRNILPKNYLIVYKTETKLTLNDSGDDVYLLQPDGFELDHTNYAEAPRGQTHARFDDGWKWTNSPTPNGKNVLSAPLPEDVESVPINEPDDVMDTVGFQKNDVLITELLPNPAETDEFIELQNNSSSSVDLKNWVLQDESKHKYKIVDFAVNIQTTSGLVIQPQQYVVITKTMSGIALNNTGGETVTLFDPSGNVIATVGYPDKAPVGAVYAWNGEIWTWSQYATPGEVNILGLDEADEPAPAVDIVLPASLPVTGESIRRRVGILLIGLALGVIVVWRKKRVMSHPTRKASE